MISIQKQNSTGIGSQLVNCPKCLKNFHFLNYPGHERYEAEMDSQFKQTQSLADFNGDQLAARLSVLTFTNEEEKKAFEEREIIKLQLEQKGNKILSEGNKIDQMFNK